jgi:hypothetical protein
MIRPAACAGLVVLDQIGQNQPILPANLGKGNSPGRPLIQSIQIRTQCIRIRTQSIQMGWPEVRVQGSDGMEEVC